MDTCQNKGCGNLQFKHIYKGHIELSRNSFSPTFLQLRSTSLSYHFFSGLFKASFFPFFSFFLSRNLKSSSSISLQTMQFSKVAICLGFVSLVSSVPIQVVSQQRRRTSFLSLGLSSDFSSLSLSSHEQKKPQRSSTEGLKLAQLVSFSKWASLTRGKNFHFLSRNFALLSSKKNRLCSFDRNCRIHLRTIKSRRLFR